MRYFECVIRAWLEFENKMVVDNCLIAAISYIEAMEIIEDHYRETLKGVVIEEVACDNIYYLDKSRSLNLDLYGGKNDI